MVYLSPTLTSQTKPGPNMAFAVAINSRFNVSTDEKDASSDCCRELGMAVGWVERVLKKKWLLCAIEAWLNSDAMLGWRAYFRRIDLVVLE
jgi:hypothetical protein